MSVMLRSLTNGLLLKAYDPDFIPPPPHPTYPNGLAEFTEDPAQALHFVDGKAALLCWTQESRSMPTRPDGLPNRPLTAMTMMLETCDD